MRLPHFCRFRNALAYLEECRQGWNDRVPDNSEEEEARVRFLELVRDFAREVEAAAPKKAD